MHEYGLPSIKSSEDGDDCNQIHEAAFDEEFDHLLYGVELKKMPKHKSPLVDFSPIEFGPVAAKYDGD
jgi:hypothetical protein